MGNTRSKARRFAPILIPEYFYSTFFLLTLTTSLCSITTAFAATEPPTEKKTPIVFLSEANKKDLFDTYSYPARVVPQVSAEVLSEAEGVVTKIYTPLGTTVKKGQELLAVKHNDPIYQYAKAIVRAPVNGVVSQIKIREGSTVNRGQEILTVTDPSKLKVVVEIAAIDLPVIRKGMQASFRSSGTDVEQPVQVVGVSPFVNPATGTATCELETSASDQKPTEAGSSRLYPGVVGQVTFRANERKAFVVPDAALYYQGKDPLLRIVDENSISKEVAVQLGKRERGTVEILSGLNEGDRFIERSSRHVANGQKVVIQNEKSKE